VEEVRILSPTAILGYGFPVSSFKAALKLKPHVIAIDAGSTDAGPYYLGAGVSFTAREAVKRDLRYILKAAHSLKIPSIIGSAGGAGAKPHLEWLLDIINEVTSEEHIKFKKSIIYSDVSKKFLLKKLREGKVSATTVEPSLTKEAITESERLVAQVGIEPFIEALNRGANLIIAGRSLDVAEFAAFPIWKGFAKGLSLHLGKILECGAIASEPGSGKDCLFGILRKDHFIVFPTNSERRCTKISIAAHSLYEKSSPLKIWVTDGYIDLSGTKFEEVDDRTVKTRDPYFISSLPKVEDQVKKQIHENFSQTKEGKDYLVRFVNYGINGVMTRHLDEIAGEVGIVMEVIAKDKKLAKTIMAFTRSTLLHIGYKGRKSTAGNLAILFSPSDFDGGKVYEFSVHHLIEVASEKEVYKIL